ncbi:hypothetical protein IIA16_01360 [bacterium]|nr:hypothetical protein [bacterium]
MHITERFEPLIRSLEHKSKSGGGGLPWRETKDGEVFIVPLGDHKVGLAKRGGRYYIALLSGSTNSLIEEVSDEELDGDDGYEYYDRLSNLYDLVRSIVSGSQDALKDILAALGKEDAG